MFFLLALCSARKLVCVCTWNHTCNLCGAGEFEFVSPSEFNLTQLQTDSQLNITFVESPDEPIYLAELTTSACTFTCQGPASVSGIAVNFTTEAEAHAVKNVTFTSCTILVLDDNVMHFSNISMTKSTLRTNMTSLSIVAHGITLDFETIAGFKQFDKVSMTCSIFVTDKFDTLEEGSISFELEFPAKEEGLIDFGSLSTDSLIRFYDDHVIFSNRGILAHIVHGDEGLIWRSILLDGTHTMQSFVKASPVDYRPPEMAIKVTNGNLVFVGEWPEGITNYMNIAVNDGCTVKLLGQGVPAVIRPQVKNDTHLNILMGNVSGSIAGSITSMSYITVDGESVTKLSCNVNNTEVPLTKFDVRLPDESSVAVGGFVGNGSHVLSGKIRFELANLTVGPFGELEVENVIVTDATLVHLQFMFVSTGVQFPNCSKIFVRDCAIEDGCSLLLRLYPLFDDAPNAVQMENLIKGFNFGVIPLPLTMIDFTLPNSGLRWFTSSTNIFYLEQADNMSLKARILDLPNDYPEFFCVADTEDPCVGQHFLHVDLLPELHNYFRDDSTELRLSVFCDIPKQYSLNLSSFAPRIVKVSSNRQPTVHIMDSAISNVELKGLEAVFTSHDLFFEDTLVLGCKLNGVKDFSHSLNVTVDTETIILNEGLKFLNCTVQCPDQENVTLTLANDSVEIVSSRMEKPCVITTAIVSGRLTVKSSCQYMWLTSELPVETDLYGFDIRLTSPCTIDFGGLNDVNFTKSPMSVDHGLYRLTITNVSYFPGVLSGFGVVQFQERNIFLTQKQFFNGTHFFDLSSTRSTMFVSECEVGSAYVYVMSKGVRMTVTYGTLNVTNSLVTDSFHVTGDMDIRENATVECSNIEIDGSLSIGGWGSLIAVDLTCAELTIADQGEVQTENATLGTLTSISSYMISSHIIINGSATLVEDSFIAGGSMSVFGPITSVFSFPAVPVIQTTGTFQPPEIVYVKYNKPYTEFVDYPSFLHVRFPILDGQIDCESIHVKFISENWYFQGDDPVMSYECNGSVNIYLARLPQPYPTRHYSLVTKDILLIGLLGGCSIIGIIVVTTIFAIRVIRDPFTREERYDPVNTALI